MIDGLELDKPGHRMIAGPTGSGKSYFIGSAVEGLYDKKIPFMIFDTKTVNHIGLIELPELKKIRVSPSMEFKNLDALREYPYILFVPASRHIAITDLIAKYREILEYLWLQAEPRIYLIEEAHNWNKNASVADPLLEQIAREGRTDKLFLWFITQQLQSFPKILWSQCTYTYLYHFNIPADVKYGAQMVPDFERINREELALHDVLAWDSHESKIIKADQITRRTPHKG